jgi:hypothetical protein
MDGSRDGSRNGSISGGLNRSHHWGLDWSGHGCRYRNLHRRLGRRPTCGRTTCRRTFHWWVRGRVSDSWLKVRRGSWIDGGLCWHALRDWRSHGRRERWCKTLFDLEPHCKWRVAAHYRRRHCVSSRNKTAASVVRLSTTKSIRFDPFHTILWLGIPSHLNSSDGSLASIWDSYNRHARIGVAKIHD